jgi:hypothetical protein
MDFINPDTGIASIIIKIVITAKIFQFWKKFATIS